MIGAFKIYTKHLVINQYTRYARHFNLVINLFTIYIMTSCINRSEIITYNIYIYKKKFF